MGKKSIKNVPSKSIENDLFYQESIAKSNSSFSIDKIKLKPLKFKNTAQKELVDMIMEKQITIVKGCAGVGKSWISLHVGLDLVLSKDNNYDKLFIITPVTETDGERIGSLPGNLDLKLEPFVYQSYYIIDQLVGKGNRIKLVESGIIQILSYSFLRGITIDNSVLIAQEAQNATTLNIKTLLTRIGQNSKFVISGDVEQIDRHSHNIKQSGLWDAYERMKGIDSIGLFEFNKSHIVRNQIISEILNKYE